MIYCCGILVKSITQYVELYRDSYFRGLHKISITIVKHKHAVILIWLCKV